MMKSKNVPKIRFKGFSDQWVENEFSNTFLPINNNTLSRAELNYDKGSVKNIHYGDVLIKFGECLDVSKEELPYVTNEKNVDKVSRLQDGDIVIADAAEDETVGKCTELLNVLNEGVVAGLHTIVCRPIFAFANGYLGYFLNASIFHNQLIPLMQGTKVFSISKSAIKNTFIYYPNVPEQTAIGNYFQNIDTLITASQNRLDKLKNIKKASLEKMFPRKGATIPEIRFKAFTGEWEEKMLGEIMIVASVKRIHQSDWTNFGIRFLRARDIVSAFKNETPTDYLYITEEKYIEYSNISGKVQKGDLLVTGVGTIGVPMLISDDTPVYFKDGNIIWFKNDNKVNDLFLYYSFTTKQLQNYIKESAGIGTVGTYTITSGKLTPILLPEMEEQTQIGNYFKNLDNLISQQEQQLTKLKNIKKGCLEKMFVNK